jgi:thiol-disulfide isomerase/thioredoxin
MNETPSKEFFMTGMRAAGYTVAFLIIFVGFYWVFRGFPPASRVVIEELPKQKSGTSGGKGGSSSATFYFFYTAWCPYSQDAKPIVESLKDYVIDYTYGGKTVIVELVNCDVDKKKCQAYNIDAYPSYKLETSSNLYTYDGPSKIDVFKEFLVSALGPEQKK